MRMGRIALINILGLLILIIIAGIGFWIWHQGYYFYSTDDAVVSGTTVNVASLTPGAVDTVNVAQGQTVGRDTTLMTLTPLTASAAGTSGGGARGGSSSGSRGNAGSGSSSSNSGGNAGSGSFGNGSSSGNTSGGSTSSFTTNGGGTSPGSVRVRAPIGNATIVNLTAQPGQIVQAGQPLAQAVDLSKAYITAYVDEGRIADVHTGQGVDVSVDAINDTTFHGHVARIIPAAQSVFSLLPTNNYYSGNFTKVAQRIPVQVTLDGLEGKTLFPGTSANVTIHIHS